jgi:hypothetical protein
VEFELAKLATIVHKMHSNAGPTYLCDCDLLPQNSLRVSFCGRLFAIIGGKDLVVGKTVWISQTSASRKSKDSHKKCSIQKLEWQVLNNTMK